MSTTTEAAPRLVSWDVKNFMRVEAFYAEPDGGHVVISGDNGTGKTSAVTSFFAALQGLKGRDNVPTPVHSGADEAYVRLDLGTHTVERIWTADDTKLVVRAANGQKVKNQQELLDSFVGKYMLDPLKFTKQKPADQVGELLNLLGVEPPVDEVREIIGDATKLIEPNLDEPADQYLQRLVSEPAGVYYLIRRDRRAKLDDKEAALTDQQAELELLGGAIREHEEPQAPSAVINEIERLTAIANQRTEAFAAWNTKRRAVGEASASLDRKRDDLQAGLSGVETLEKQVEALRRELAENEAKILSEQARVQEMSESCDRDEAKLLSLASAADAAKAAADRMPDPSDQIGQKKEQLRNIEATNRKLSERSNCQVQVIRLETETAMALQGYQQFDQIVAKIRELRAHLIDETDLGFPGLCIGEGELLLNGVSVKQASNEEQVRLGATIAMMQEPLLKVLRVDDGERLGTKSRQLLFDIATERGWQVIFTKVSDQAELSFEIVDGR